MSNPDQVDGSTVLFKATPIHEGPLNGYHNDPQKNFRSATYNVAKTDKEITLYRLYGGNTEKSAKEDGSWWTPVKPEAYGKNALDSRIDYAILESWPNTMENCAEIRVPADTLMFTGIAGEQVSANEYENLFYKHGGKCQVFLPREIMNGLFEYKKSKTNANTFKQAAAIPQRLNTIIYQPPTNKIREIRKFTQQSVKSTFINNNNIPRNQCYISSPWPGGIELVQALPIFYNQRKIENPKMSIQNSSFSIIDGNKKHEIREFGISSVFHNLPTLSPEEIKALHAACINSTKSGIMISLELYNDRIDTITDGFDLKKYPQIYETIKEADAILGNFIFGTNLFQAAVEENTKIELTKSAVSTYKNPCILELELLKGKDRKSLEAQKDACNFGFIGPHPKFVINKNAKLYIKDDKLICDGCPLDICIRGVYQDFYGNTYYDDAGKRCYKNHSFVSDFRKNFWNYFETYPILKKVATYAIFIAATLNCKSLNHEKIDFQTISKTPRKTTSNNESEEIEIKILEAKEDLFRQKPSNPLAWNLLGNEWCKYDVIKARSFYFEALLEIHCSETLMNVKRKIETDYYKKQIVKNACHGILTTSIYGNDENKKFTDGEKKILCKMFAIEEEDDYSI
uniref:Uncharacterized protein n=1 Tax=Panagrolaimus sp. PS1159 TaxID=55785 RepID=A0AC35GT11_9BILA